MFLLLDFEQAANVIENNSTIIIDIFIRLTFGFDRHIPHLMNRPDKFVRRYINSKTAYPDFDTLPGIVLENPSYIKTF